MTEKQIEAWRNVLLSRFGPCALLLPRETIEGLRNAMQNAIDEREKKACVESKIDKLKEQD